jgi:hypothetical protein
MFKIPFTEDFMTGKKSKNIGIETILCEVPERNL